ncbi:uncharacterized protein LOC144436830 [Glandiceps talaboti]
MVLVIRASITLCVLLAKLRLSEETCLDPGNPINGYRATEVGIINQNQYIDGAIITYDCDNSYSMNGSAMTQCNGSIWNKPVPTCIQGCVHSDWNWNHGGCFRSFSRTNSGNTWLEALDICLDNNAFITIYDSREQVAGSSGDRGDIGLVYMNNEWTWFDGTPLDENLLGRYGLPSSSSQRCAWERSRETWDDWWCDRSLTWDASCRERQGTGHELNREVLNKVSSYIYGSKLGGCPWYSNDETKLRNDKAMCYSFMFQEFRPWHDAKELCSSINGTLPTIRDRKDNMALVGLAALYMPSGFDGFWIDLNDIDDEGIYTDGESQQTDYFKWKYNQPSGGRDENCVAMYLSDAGRWHDRSCGEGLGVVCVLLPVNVTVDVFPETTYVSFGETATFECGATGNPIPTIQWFTPNDTVITTDDATFRITESSLEGNHIHTLNSELVILNSDRYVNGTYYCSITNGYTSDYLIYIDLVVYERPDPVIILATSPTETQQISLSWRLTFTGNLEVTHCNIEYRNSDFATWMFYDRVNGPGSHYVHTINQLNPDTMYQMRIRCANEEGYSDYTESDWVKTNTEGEALPEPSPPYGVTAVSWSSTQIKVMWTPAAQNALIHYYIVYYSIYEGDVLQSEQTSGLEGDIILNGLQPNTKYEIFVTAVHSEENIQESQPSHLVYQTTDKNDGNGGDVDIPSAPSELTAMITSYSDTSVCQLCWRAPENGNGIIRYYIIEYSISIRDTNVIDGNGTWLHVAQTDVDVKECYKQEESLLKRYSDYHFTVTAVSHAGRSVPSRKVIGCSTNPSAPPRPLPPVSLIHEDVDSPNTIWIRVSEASSRHGPVRCYDVIVAQVEVDVNTRVADFPLDSNPDILFPVEAVTSYDEAFGNAGTPYSAVKLLGTDYRAKVLLGDGERSSCKAGTDSRRSTTKKVYETEAHNGELDPNANYVVFVRVYVDNPENDNEVFFTSSPLMGPIITGLLMSSVDSKSSNIVVIIVPVTIVVIVIIAAVTTVTILLIFKKRKENQDQNRKTKDADETDDNYTELADVTNQHIYTGLQNKERDNTGNPSQVDKCYANVEQSGCMDEDKTYYDFVEK